MGITMNTSSDCLNPRAPMRLVWRVFLLAGLFALYGQSFGQSWVQITPQFSTGDSVADFSKGMFATRNAGWVMIDWYDNVLQGWDNRIFKTTDGGYHWLLQKEMKGTKTFEKCFVYDSLHCWFLESSTGSLVRTTNGGTSWDSASISDRNWIPGFSGLYFFNTLEGVALNRFPWFTTDGGMHWTPGDTTLVISGVKDMYFADRNHGWIASSFNPWAANYGVILKTADGGATWSYQGDTSAGTFRTPLMYGIMCLDAATVFAVGNTPTNDGYFYWTGDGGNTWNHVAVGNRLFDVGFMNRDHGWISCGGGRIQQTTDGGTTWTQTATGLDGDLRRVKVIPGEKVVFLLGTNNVLLRADVITGIRERGGAAPDRYALLQNYPDPFNPTTRIPFALPRETIVNLSVYDLLGREVKVLLDGRLAAGYHEILFDAGDLPSGVYFYRLTSPGLSVTRRMAIIR